MIARLLRAPATHFAVIGVALYAASAWLSPPEPEAAPSAASREIVIDAVRIRGLRNNYALANQVRADEAAARALVESAVVEEILFREALARGLEQGDRAVAWRLVQKMRFLGEDRGEDVTTLYHKALGMGLHRADPVVRRILTEKVRILVGRAAPDPTPGELEAWYAANSSRYSQPSRITLRHAFFDRSKRGEDGARAAAEEEAASLAADPGRRPAGDAFVMGTRLVAQSPGDIVKFFGPDFAAGALATPVGSWKGPMESSYGWHVVFIEKREDERIPALAEVRGQAVKAWEAEQREERVREFLDKVRPTYVVRIDEAAIREAGGA